MQHTSSKGGDGSRETTEQNPSTEIRLLSQHCRVSTPPTEVATPFRRLLAVRILDIMPKVPAHFNDIKQDNLCYGMYVKHGAAQGQRRSMNSDCEPAHWARPPGSTVHCCLRFPCWTDLSELLRIRIVCISGLSLSMTTFCLIKSQGFHSRHPTVKLWICVNLVSSWNSCRIRKCSISFLSGRTNRAPRTGAKWLQRVVCSCHW